jgi:hypothetical protein
MHNGVSEQKETPLSLHDQLAAIISTGTRGTQNLTGHVHLIVAATFFSNIVLSTKYVLKYRDPK